MFNCVLEGKIRLCRAPPAAATFDDGVIKGRCSPLTAIRTLNCRVAAIGANDCVARDSFLLIIIAGVPALAWDPGRKGAARGCRAYAQTLLRLSSRGQEPPSLDPTAGQRKVGAFYQGRCVSARAGVQL